ncbi:MAG: arginine--tRNA ligase [Fulvivirga sp.]
MTDMEKLLQQAIVDAFKALFDHELAIEEVALQPTRKEFEGSHTFVCFPYARISKKKPEETATVIGEYLVEHVDMVKGFNVVKGFLNIVLTDKTWIDLFSKIWAADNYGVQPPNGKEVMVEYSSPNTNKPLHLGHLRNNFLGWSVSEILKANGYDVHKVQIINDRGIHICKSMVAWLKYGEGATPESTGKKGDKLVGDYYVKFDQEYKKQIAELVDGGMDKARAEKVAPIMKEAQELLLKWEQKDPDTYALWEKMNGWVYEGFDATYKQMGVDFDKLYYESQTFLLGKEEAMKGVEKGIFFKKEDGSVWVDLTEEGLDEKLLLRADGTSVYMTQDIGTAILRYRDYPKISQQIYTVGNEQEYHFKVLFMILDKIGYEWAKECYHLSYGMVDLPSGKMKSREGTVVDADDLMAEMINTAREHTEELGKIDGFTEDQAADLYEILGLGALKYFLLKVDPRKRMLFDPNESIQFQGNTGPFIQYTHARIAAILRKAEQLKLTPEDKDLTTLDALQPVELSLIFTLKDYPEKVKEAGENYSPDIIAQYVYDLAKEYNRFYQEVSIFNEEDETALKFRVALSAKVAEVINKGMGLLGAHVPERM